VADLQTLNADLARVLGVGDVSGVTRITLTLQGNDLPRVAVERIYLPGAPCNQLVDKLSTAVSVHHLVPSEPTETPQTPIEQ
jgi:hypothetical protein